jgi:hypothetical protein
MVTLAEFQGLRRVEFRRAHAARDLDSTRCATDSPVRSPVAVRVTQAIREQSSVDQALSQYEALYDEVMSDPIQASPGTAGPSSGHGTVAARLNNLEAELAVYRRPERMPACRGSDCRDPARSRERAGDDEDGASAFARVRSAQRPDEPGLGSWPPYPLQWVYRWRPFDTAEFWPKNARTSDPASGRSVRLRIRRQGHRAARSRPLRPADARSCRSSCCGWTSRLSPVYQDSDVLVMIDRDPAG